MKQSNLALASDRREVVSEQLFSYIEQLEVFVSARCVALFCALPDEPATERVLALWSRSKRVVVPRVEGAEMRFYDYDPATLCPGAFGIAEPGAAAHACDPAQIDLMLVPGVAFTLAGARLGRGRGYYDRYLSQPAFRATKVGVCYAHQVVAELTVEPHDVAMDCICNA